MSYKEFGVCDWCKESFAIRHGCECKKLASNQEWLNKAGLIKKHAKQQKQITTGCTLLPNCGFLY